MPQINRQAPAVANPRPLLNGSILARAVPVASTPRAPVKLLIYGGNRTGKTTLACQAAKPLLIISCEPAMSGGYESVRLVPGIDVLKFGNQEQMRNGEAHFSSTAEFTIMAHELAKGSKYKTVVIDSASSLQDIILMELMNLPAVPDQLNWGTVGGDIYRNRSEKCKEHLRPYLNLKMDTIILAKEKDHNPPKEEKINERTGKVQPDMRPKFLRGLQQESFIASDLGGATTGWLQDACDGVVRLFVEEEMEKTELVLNKGKPNQSISVNWKPTGKYIRYLRMQYHPNYAAGVRSPHPELVPEVMENPTFAKILKVLRG